MTQLHRGREGGLKMVQSRKVQDILIRNSSLVFLLLLLVFNVLFTNGFVSIQTLWNMVIQIAPVVLVALGMTFVISSGGIDISVGSAMAISGMLVVQLLTKIGLIPAFLAGLVAGGILGAINGIMISTFHIQPIIVTLGTQIAGRGIAQLIGNGYILRFDSESLMNIAAKRLGGIPIQLLYLVLLVALFLFIAKKTVFARYVEAMGDNYKASWISGVKVVKVTISLYVVSALMSSLAGILTVARAGAADPDTIGSGLELTAIAAVAIGDTKMAGGKAKVIGTILGAVILQLVSITFNMNNVPYEWSLAAKTFIIILAVFLQNIRGD